MLTSFLQRLRCRPWCVIIESVPELVSKTSKFKISVGKNAVAVMEFLRGHPMEQS